MDKKYQIFISSTYEDLKEERQAVIETVLRMHHFPVGMEAFGARSKEQWDIIKETIDTSDYYVLIIKHRYGTIEPTSGKSYTELEFDYAVSKKIPVLAFIIKDDVPILPDDIEKNHLKEFEDFKEKVKNKRIIEFWSNKDDLSSKLASSLHNEFEYNERVGWVRADSSKNNVTIDETHKLSNEAIVLLLYASEAETGRISVTLNSISPSGNILHVGKKTITNNSRKDASKWDSAIELLIKKTFIVNKIKSSQIYELTGAGYIQAEKLKEQYCLNDLTDPVETLIKLANGVV